MAYAGTDWWPPMVAGQPGAEGDIYTLDFTNDLSAGETLVQTGNVPGMGAVEGAVTVTDVNGVDGEASSRLQLFTLTSPFVSAQLANGVAGANYRVSATYPTSQGRALTLYSHIAAEAEF